MQVYVPLNSKKANYEVTKPFAKAIAQLLEKETPDGVVSIMKKVEREGKVFVDWSQNHQRKTTVAVYSLRARDQPDRLHPGHLGRGRAVAESGDKSTSSPSRPTRSSPGSRSTAISSPRCSSSSRSCRSSSRRSGVVVEASADAARRTLGAGEGDQLDLAGGTEAEAFVAGDVAGVGGLEEGGAGGSPASISARQSATRPSPWPWPAWSGWVASRLR